MRPTCLRACRSALALAALYGLAVALTAPAAAQTFKVLHSFAGYPKDGGAPLGGLLMDSAGNLYGTTLQGGKYGGCQGLVGCGTVFKLDTNRVETVLHNFNGSDGAGSSATLIMNANGISTAPPRSEAGVVATPARLSAAE
jgi:uncharacterized repeat protein (TIGR03803 family)